MPETTISAFFCLLVSTLIFCLYFTVY